MAVVADKWVFFVVHLLLNLLDSSGQNGGEQKRSNSVIAVADEVLPLRPDARESSGEIIGLGHYYPQAVDVSLGCASGGEGESELISGFDFEQDISDGSN